MHLGLFKETVRSSVGISCTEALRLTPAAELHCSSVMGLACREEKDTDDIFDDAEEKPMQQQDPSPPPDPLADHSLPKPGPKGQVCCLPSMPSHLKRNAKCYCTTAKVDGGGGEMAAICHRTGDK